MDSSSTKLNLSLSHISSSKILKLDYKNLKIFNDKIQIISIENFDSLNEVESLLESFEQENFPNAFFIRVDSKDDASTTVEDCQNKFSKFRQILLQINSKYFLKEAENFKELKVDLSDDEIQKSLNDSKLSTEIFLSLQKSSKTFEGNFEKILMNVVNSQDNFCLRLLKLFGFKLSKDVESEVLRPIIRGKSFETFLAFLNVLDVSQVNEAKVKEILSDDKLFLIAVESQNFEVLKLFLKFQNLLNFKLFKKAVDLSIKKEFFHVFIELKNSKFGSHILFQSGEKILIAIEKLHESIKSGNLSDVKKFAENFKDQRLCYGLNEFCALELAIVKKKFEIFSFLRASNFYTDKGSELDDKISKLSATQKLKIRVENLKYVKEFPDAFIGILLSKCKFDALSPISSPEVHEMLTDLSRVDDLRPILEIASQADLKIIFDFATESVKSMDPSADDCTMGLAYFGQGELYVGRDREKLLRYSTFMHELCHSVLYLIYENDYLPYCEGDDEREREWTRILEHQKLNCTEEIVRAVFKFYEAGYTQLAELAVRPSHIMAQYLNDPLKVEEIRESHRELFDFIKTFVLRDLQIPNVFRLITLNKNFETIKRIEGSNLQLKSCESFEIINEKFEKFVLTSNVPKLALSKLLQEIKNSSKNRLDVKVKNIFVDVEKLRMIHFENEVKSLLKSCEIDRIIFDVTNAKNVQKSFDFIRNFDCASQVIVVCDESQAQKFIEDLNFEKVSVTFGCENLTDETHKKLLQRQINYQGINFEVSNFLTSISSESLPLLCSDKKILVNFDKTLKLIENFIPRIVERGKVEFTLDEFMVEVESEKVVVISDVAGSGKSTLLLKLHEMNLSEFPDFWVNFVNLRDYVEQFSKSSLETFVNSFTEILNLNPIEREIFTQKFHKGEAKIFFDAFDEISPNCKDETLKLFELFMTQNGNQIFITTRTHFEYDLEKELNVKSFKIKVLSECDQIKILCDFWKNSHDDANFIKTCALQLTQKISEIIKNHPNLIGIPIIIQSVAKLYVNKINENFPNEIKNLKIFEVYEKILEECLKILNKNQPTNVTKRLSPLQVHEFLTVVHFFGKSFAAELGLKYDPKEWPIEEISRYGIISYGRDGKITFNHLTFAEHLLSKFVDSILINFQELSKAHLKFFTILLTEEKFEITRTFVDEMLENFESKTFTIFKSREDLKILNLTVDRKLSNLFKVFLNSNLKDFCEIEEKIEESLLTVAESCESFAKFFDVVQSFFGENFFDDFLLKVKPKSSNFFKFFVKEKTLTFFESLAETLKGENLNKLLLYQNKNLETFLHFTVEDFEKFQNILESIQRNASEDVQKVLIYMKNSRGENVLMTSLYKSESSLKFLLTFTETFDKSEMEKFLCEVDKSGNNILHIAALNLESFETFKLLCLKFFEIFKLEPLRKYLKLKGDDGENILLRSIRNKNEELFFFIFDDIFCKFFEFKEMIYESDVNDENFLHKVARFGSNLTIKFCFEKLRDELSNDELKNFLKKRKIGNFLHFCATLNFERFENVLNIFQENVAKNIQKILIEAKNSRGQNILMLSSEEKFLKFLELAESCMSKSEMEIFLSEVDCDGNNILHISSQTFKSKKVFEHLLYQISKNVKNPKEFFNRSGKFNRNALQKSIESSPQIFQPLFNLMKGFCDSHHELENLILAKNSEKENLLTLAVRLSTKPALEALIFKVFEIFGKEEFKKFLKTTRGPYRRTLLTLATENDDGVSIEFLLKIYKQTLTRQEIFEILISKDKYFDTFLHHSAAFLESKENFEFLWLKILENFKPDPKELKKILLLKGFQGENVLMSSIQHENLFFYIFDEIFCKYLKFKHFVFEYDDDGENFLHKVVKNGSKAMIEFVIEKLKENLTVEELKEFLVTKSLKSQQNILKFAGLNETNSDVEKFVLEILQKIFDENDMKEIKKET